MTRRGLNFNLQTGTGQQQIHTDTGGISLCRRTQTPSAWIHAAWPPRGQSTARWLLCLVCRQHISKSGCPHERAHFVCVYFSVCVFSLTRPRKALYPSFLCSATCFSRLPILCMRPSERGMLLVPTCMHLHLTGKQLQAHAYVQHDWLFYSKPSSYFRRHLIQAESKGMIQTMVRDPSGVLPLTPVGFSWGFVLNYLQSLLLKKIFGHGLQSTKPLTWNTTY